MSGVSWRDAGYTDEDGRRVRDWVVRNLDAADGATTQALGAHPDGLGETPIDPAMFLNLDDPERVQADGERKRWTALLDAIDQGGAAGFMKAHAEWVKAGSP